MPLSDDPYTNPMTLRQRYLAPRSLAAALEFAEELAASARAQESVAVSSEPPTRRNPIIGCPAVGQFVAVFVDGNVESVPAESLVNNLREWFCYDYIAGEASKVVYAEIVKNVECAKLRTFDGVEKVSSLSAPIIQSFSDNTGIPISKIIQDVDVFGAVTCVDSCLAETDIEMIATCGKRSVVRITLADRHILWTGTVPNKLSAEHNAKAPSDVNDFPIEIE